MAASFQDLEEAENKRYVTGCKKFYFKQNELNNFPLKAQSGCNTFQI